jgi:hypothetical protein
MARSIRVDFWRLAAQDEAGEEVQAKDVRAALKDLCKKQVYLDRGDRYFEIRNIHEFAGKPVLAGYIRKIQNKDLPKKSRLRGADEDLGLDPDQGLGYRSYFMIDFSRGWLLWIGARAAGGPGLLREFLAERQIDAIIGLLLSADAWDRLKKHSGEIKQVRMKVASIDGAGASSPGNWSQDYLKHIRHVGASFMDVTLGVDLRMTHEPLKKGVIGWLEDLTGNMRAQHAQVDFMPNSGLEPIDLVKDRVTYDGHLDTGLQQANESAVYQILAEALRAKT